MLNESTGKKRKKVDVDLKVDSDQQTPETESSSPRESGSRRAPSSTASTPNAVVQKRDVMKEKNRLRSDPD